MLNRGQLVNKSWNNVARRSKDILGDMSQPRIFSLQKLVEVADFNMDSRGRIVWANVWGVLSQHFSALGVHPNRYVSGKKRSVIFHFILFIYFTFSSAESSTFCVYQSNKNIRCATDWFVHVGVKLLLYTAILIALAVVTRCRKSSKTIGVNSMGG